MKEEVAQKLATEEAARIVVFTKMLEKEIETLTNKPLIVPHSLQGVVQASGMFFGLGAFFNGLSYGSAGAGAEAEASSGHSSQYSSGTTGPEEVTLAMIKKEKLSAILVGTPSSSVAVGLIYIGIKDQKKTDYFKDYTKVSKSVAPVISKLSTLFELDAANQSLLKERLTNNIMAEALRDNFDSEKFEIDIFRILRRQLSKDQIKSVEIVQEMLLLADETEGMEELSIEEKIKNIEYLVQILEVMAKSEGVSKEQIREIDRHILRAKKSLYRINKLLK